MGRIRDMSQNFGCQLAFDDKLELRNLSQRIHGPDRACGYAQTGDGAVGVSDLGGRTRQNGVGNLRRPIRLSRDGGKQRLDEILIGKLQL